ncbi:hybrid sensor histidine kinase/response regulator [Xinfangfangia pollutisoli]|uniref:hybrid sensor histidine kinase/response regulator n=1 Tax=Xinfangfangia pollutisoli TaxID=2865960 RepID=UPI001CD80F28|nr:ATP-binding protein [Xinfangfangia pollutisoli]
MRPADEDEAAEIAWQGDILAREFPERIGLICLAFALCTIYLDPLPALLLGAVNVIAEYLNLRITQDANRRISRRGYYAQLILSFTTETAYISAAGLVWIEDDPYSKAFAVGMVMSALLHLSSVRSIHLPIGLAGLAAVALGVAAFDTYYWVQQDSPLGLALSATAAFCAMAYTFIAMLSNNRLHRAMRVQEMRASRADAAKARFLAVLSHEMRTPLNAVLGLGHVAWTEAEDPTQRETLGQLVGAARDLATIVDDATDMSAIADGRFRLRERQVDPAAELGAAIEPFRLQAERQGSSLRLDLRQPLPSPVLLDPQRFRQCLANLVANALKHAGAGPIRVEAAPIAEGFEVIVADSGPGIAAAEADLVFEPFRRGRTGTQGSGLGLTICRALARQMGGDVTLVPTPQGQQGARFRLWLPARAVLGLADLAPRTAEAPGATADLPPDLRGRTVLIVDDIATNRLVAAMHLRPTHARVIEADSGAQALEVLTREQVDLILLDLNMPGMDGVETVAAIRALRGRNARVPVVAMTADATANDLQRMNGVLVKPLNPAGMLAEIRRHLAA